MTRNNNLQSYINYQQAEGYTEKTIRVAIRNLSYFQQGMSKPLTAINYQDLLDHISTLEVKPQTINNRLKDVKNYFAYLIKTNQATYNPALGLQLRNKEITYHQNLSKNQLDHIYQNYHPGPLSYKILLGLIIYQGAEAGTLAQLQKQDVKLEKGTIDLPKTARFNPRTLNLETTQIIPLYRYLEEHTEEKMFTNTRVTSLLYRSMNQLKKQFSEVKSVRQLRASRIKAWLKEYNLREVQYRCGHRYISSTEQYKEVDLESMKEALKRSHPLG